MKFRSILLALALAVALAPAAHAESSFSHHLDALHVSASEGEVQLNDLGYHFTTVSFDRIDLLGLGAGVDFLCDPCGATPKLAATPYLSVHLASVRLADIKKGILKGRSVSAGAEFAYNVKLEAWRFAAGFSLTL